MTPELRAKLAGRRVVASLSGGKDSSALSLWLKEQEIEHDRISFNTGWESEKAGLNTWEYIRGDLENVVGPIVELKGALPMAQLVVKRGMFPSRARRFCTEELKTFPARDYLHARMEAGEDVVNAIGIRRSESIVRSQMPEWEWQSNFDCEVWRPLVDWTLDDVIAIHQRHGLRPNPLYLKGFKRVGCWPCINSNKAEIRRIAELDPGRIDDIRRLEHEVGKKARARYDARLERFKAGVASKRDLGVLLDADGRVKPFSAPSFFQSPLKEEGGAPWPIDRVVAWSRTRYGGREEDKQADLLAFGGINDGCMRWGLCDTGGEK